MAGIKFHLQKLNMLDCNQVVIAINLSAHGAQQQLRNLIMLVDNTLKALEEKLSSFIEVNMHHDMQLNSYIHMHMHTK